MSRLIDAGYDINARDEDESTPLNYAIGANNLAAVRLLFSHGADTTLRDLGGSDGVRDNASMLAARINAIAVMQELIAAGDRIHSHALAFAVMGEYMAMIRLLLENATGDFSDVARREGIE
jgi:ankyrin repeat protein